MALTNEIETTCCAPFLRVTPDIAENTERIAVNGILEVSYIRWQCVEGIITKGEHYDWR